MALDMVVWFCGSKNQTSAYRHTHGTKACDDDWTMFGTPSKTGEYQQLFVNTHTCGSDSAPAVMESAGRTSAIKLTAAARLWS
jgi:hypothetical protein